MGIALPGENEKKIEDTLHKLTQRKHQEVFE